ncbi:gamma-aminobutyric acid receptor subunit beta-4-like isoform X2 [Actinia tenebrosa]|uniref:Gamma-aminobutyric acid receptor subunit beta n=1 Tax=Actinia tenebrosa TaxID=6105 RepID=A0A6P8HU37_ACTTE|nr:gamma-aminobutyric acid receptor subunit beta-4-like isoform X2 [Actinia tenebrosa]
MISLFILSLLAVASSSTQSKKNHVSSILDRILIHEKYDKRLRPNYEDGPVIVKVGFWVLSIDSINVVDMDYSLDIFLRQSWKDERMAHELNKTMFLSNTVMDRIWMPDSYFVNAKHGAFHKVTKDNMMIMIDPVGLVQYNARVTIRLSCPMDLRAFPMDTQSCPLTIESCNWSGIKATFTFERLYSYFIIHVYGPCSLIVIISWVSFLLPREQAPARITLGVTSVLTVVTVLNMLNNTMPKVNYVKTIDKYLIGCFLFVFATLLEYSLVLWFSKRSKKYKQEKEEWTKKYNLYTDKEEQEKINCKQKMNNGKLCSSQLVVMEQEQNEALLGRRFDSPAKTRTRTSTLLLTAPFPCNKIKEFLYSETFVLAIDGYALVFFPFGFITFNAVYWISFLSFSDIFGL